MNNTRTIHLGLFSKNAEMLLSSLFEHIIHTKPYRVARNIQRANLVVNPDNELVIQGKLRDQYYYSPVTIWDRNIGNDYKPREWVAIMLKRHVIEQCGNDGAWRRGNNLREVPKLEFKDPADGHVIYRPTVSEAYYVYDVLLSRKRIELKYSKELIDKMHGVQNDPIATEMEIARRDEVARIQDEYEQTLKNLDHKKSEEIENYREKMNEKYDLLRKEAAAKLKADLKNLDEIAKMGAF